MSTLPAEELAVSANRMKVALREMGITEIKI